MKKKTQISGVLIITLFLLLVSCEKEKPLSEAILGKWQVVTMTQVTFENNVKKAEITIFLDANEMTYQFIDGGSGIFFDDTDDYLFSWTLTGDQLTISDLYTEDLVVNLTIDGDALTWSYKENDPQTAGKSYEFIVNAERID